MTFSGPVENLRGAHGPFGGLGVNIARQRNSAVEIINKNCCPADLLLCWADALTPVCETLLVKRFTWTASLLRG
jgi:hypothetical protein